MMLIDTYPHACTPNCTHLGRDPRLAYNDCAHVFALGLVVGPQGATVTCPQCGGPVFIPPGPTCT